MKDTQLIKKNITLVNAVGVCGWPREALGTIRRCEHVELSLVPASLRVLE